MIKDNFTFQNTFEHIFCLNLSHRKDRRQKMISQLEKLELLHSPNFEWHISTSHIHSGIMAKAINNSGQGRFSFPNELNCAREHYSIVKHSFDFGYKNVLIIEDDVLILKDLNHISDSLKNIPEDWDILQFGAFSCLPETLEAEALNEYWMRAVKAWNCSMYALNRKGMEFYLKCQEAFFTVADHPLYIAHMNQNIINSYLAISPIVIQELTDSNGSDIRPINEATRDINVNIYEKNIDRNQYGL